MRNTPIRVFAFMLLSAALASLPLAGASRAAIGNGGELFELRAGTFGELFADGTALAADRPVLALDLAGAGEPRRLLVPGTDDPAAESAPIVLYDRVSGILTALWQSRAEDGTGLHLASWDGEDWSEVLEVARGEGELGVVHAFTRERYVFTLPDEREVRSERSILHLLWQDESSASALRYSPLIFVDGAFVGWNPVISLLDLFAPLEKSSASLAPSLAGALALGGRGRSLTTTFVDPRDQQLVTLGITSLPLELAYLADSIREQVLDAFAGVDAEGLAGIGDDMRAHIIQGGLKVGAEETLVSYVADVAVAWSESWLVLHPEATIEDFADALWKFVVDLTSAILSTGHDGEGGSIAIHLGDHAQRQPAQVLDVQILGRRPAPETDEGLTRIYASDDGREMIVAWFDAETSAVRWVESVAGDEGPWSEPRSLAIGEDLSLGRAHALLRDRVD